MRLRIAATLLACGFLAACSASVYKDEITGLSTAGKNLTGTVSSYYQNNSAAIWSDTQVIEVIRGQTLQYAGDCEKQARAAFDSIDGDWTANRVISDTDMKIFPKTVAPCDLPPPPPTPGAATGPAPPDNSAATTDDAAKPSQEQTASAEARLAAICAAQSEAAPAAAPAAPPAKPAKPDPKKLMGALNGYFTALQGITDADTLSDLQKNEKAALDSANGLAKAASAPATAGAAAGVFSTLLQLGIEQRRYETLRHVVTALDCALPGSAPAIKTSLRFLQGDLIVSRAQAARLAASDARTALNDASVIKQAAQRLVLFRQLEPDLAAKNDLLMAAVKADPGTTVDAFVKAHHELALALVDTDRQIQPLIDSLSALGTSVGALNTAINPPPKGK